MSSVHYRRWIAIAACAAIAPMFLFRFYLSKSRPDKKKASAAEGEVYEAVVRDMVTSHRLSQLVFDDTVLTELRAGADIKSCKGIALLRLRLESGKLLYDSLADKVYRFLASGTHDDSLRTDTVHDFLEKACTVGRLSRTFRTDLPRTFIGAESVGFEDWEAFRRQFPGASGIISLSHVGLDSRMDEAIVSTAFVCGNLCGSGHRYVLRKKRGRWEVVNKWMVWVS